MLVAGLEQPQDQSMLFFLYCSTLCHILASRASVSTRQQPFKTSCTGDENDHAPTAANPKP